MSPVYGTLPSLMNVEKQSKVKNEINTMKQEQEEPLATTTSTAISATSLTSTFESEFVIHRQAIKTGDYDKAIQSFVSLQASSMDNSIFQDYLIEIANNIHPSRDTELSGFFAALPCLLQSNIIGYAKDRLQSSKDLKAFQVLFDYIKAYPRHAYKYMMEAICILIQFTQIGSPDDREKCSHLLVTDLLPRLCKQRLQLTCSEYQSSVKSTDSKHYIIIPYTLYETYISIGQQYYIGKRQWDELAKFTCMMISSCGYDGFDQLHAVSHTIRFQYLKENRLKVRIDDDIITSTDNRTIPDDDEARQLKISATLMCEYMAVVSQFVSFGYDYYKAVCGENEIHSSSSSTLEKSCLIPICSFQPSAKSTSGNNRNVNINSNDNSFNKSTTTATTTPISPSLTDLTHGNQKRPLEASIESENGTQRQKKVKLDMATHVDDRGQGLFSDCLKGVDQALQILSKAADCLRHLVQLWQWATLNSTKHDWADQLKSWEAELNRIIDEYRLPFDTKNAILLLQSDLALSSPSVPGNLAKALELSQTICDRIEVERRKGQKSTRNKDDSPELNIPFMFAFRVLYNIAVIYLLVGSIQESTLEIAIILSVFPIPIELDEKAFIADELDCNTVTTVFQDHEFGLMRVNQVGLVTRCIKHLVVSLDNESEQKGGMASIDAAMRWDEKAGNMIVLMQYGWPYWRSRTGMWNKIIQRIQEKRIFKNREFLEYVYVEDILKVIQSIHDSESAILDIIPPEFALRASYRHLVAPHTGSTIPPSNEQDNRQKSNTSTTTETKKDHDEDDDDDKDSTITSTTTSTTGVARLAPPPTYQPSFANRVLPSMSMSPSWYAASTQKNDYTSWMSPSFYYSRPATSVVLPKKQKERNERMEYQQQEGEEIGKQEHSNKHRLNHEKGQELERGISELPSFTPRDIVSRCLDYRLQRYSPKVTPQRMRHVLQKFLKNMVLKGNDES
ncbi:uncharacterized protein BX664DRAFT_283744 [Halteromyces radiatus]|uniref:uncharacterized protein n=1 Tax=Halteromyces radiatus TaxID=101107 RepID=UPI00221F1A88|nr:uncharacterized protein BX664DRAFT_283744 [Halteromyces radiatus]KAI8084879.1 hypothetical protein BX664DRAFT_283744 [Halteromyces radiatus]